MYICKYVCKYLDLIWCIDCVFVTRKKNIFFEDPVPYLCPFLARRHRMLRKRRSQGQRRQGQLFFMFFFSFFFFRQGHFPTQVFTCQEETQTSYGHRCGHIWSQYGVLRFMGIELRMWYYDTLDCTNIYICYPIGVLGQEKSDAGQPDPPNKPEAKYPSGVAGFSLFIYIYN